MKPGLKITITYTPRDGKITYAPSEGLIKDFANKSSLLERVQELIAIYFYMKEGNVLEFADPDNDLTIRIEHTNVLDLR